jgi:RecA-family ATPase
MQRAQLESEAFDRHIAAIATQLEPQPKAGRAIVTPMSQIKRQDLKWLWQGRFALGKLTVIVGDPGLGKSFSTLDMASRVTTGRQWPDGAPACDGAVILSSAEDDPADTIRPRLEASGADLVIVDFVEISASGHATGSSGRCRPSTPLIYFFTMMTQRRPSRR